jgi:hypothetical protein
MSEEEELRKAILVMIGNKQNMQSIRIPQEWEIHLDYWL